jgi:DNA mismatch endonuclease (patch repair protein)
MSASGTDWAAPKPTGAPLPQLPPPPRASSAAARNVMRANRKTGTQPELRLRRALHRLGLRYRVGRRLPSPVLATPDLIFVRYRVAIFVDGCFWHGCPDHGVQPKVNVAYWTAKLALNRARDLRVDAALHSVGWLPIRVWEHDDPDRAAEHIRAAVTRMKSHVIGT